MVQNILVHLFWKNVKCGTFYLKSWVSVSVLSFDICFQINRGCRCKYLCFSLSLTSTPSLSLQKEKKRDDVICFHPPQNITASQHLRALSSYFIRHAGACCLLQTNTASRVNSPTGVRFRSDTRHFDVSQRCLIAIHSRTREQRRGNETLKRMKSLKKTTQIISIIFSSTKHCTEFPGAGWGL